MRYQDRRHPIPGPGAGPHTVEVLVVSVPVRRPEVTHLGQVVGQAQGGAVGQIVAALPVGWGIALLELDV